MFSDWYSFSIGNDYYYPIHKYTIATLNREQTHQDVFEGAKRFSLNSEIIENNEERRRGSDVLILVDDRYYIWSSRTGMEQSGNAIQISENAPRKLSFLVLETVFKNILERKFGDIRDKPSKNQLTKNISTITPRDFIIQKELTEEEQKNYYSEIADLTLDMLDDFYAATTPNELKEIVSEFSEKQTNLFREFTSFEPSIVSQVINSLEGFNGWIVPDEIDAGNTVAILMHEDMDYGKNKTRRLNIDIISDTKVELIEVINNKDKVLQTAQYDSIEELNKILNQFMKCTPETVSRYR